MDRRLRDGQLTVKQSRRVSGNRHKDTSDLDIYLERVTGIEPALSAWEADVLPLNYTRVRLHRHDLTISPGRVRADIVPEPIGCEGAPLRS